MADECSGSGDDSLFAGAACFVFRLAGGARPDSFRGSGAVALGACLAAFYLLPAIYEQRWINIAQAVSAGSRPADNFLFIHTTDADHDAFNHIISWVAVLEMVLDFVAAGLERTVAGQRSANFGMFCSVWAIACSAADVSGVSGCCGKSCRRCSSCSFPGAGCCA